MRRLFTLMSDQVQGTGQQLRTWWDTLSPDPSTWTPFTWVLVALVAVILLVLLIRPRRRAARRPELLISHGELRVAAWAAPKVVSSLQAPRDVAYELAMTVSNLSASPVQLLELAVRTNAASAPTAAEVAAVLPPHGAVDVTADLQEAGGDEGVLDLFVYVPDMPPKTFRVRAKLLWEPWNARYRVLPLDQRVDVARGFSERAQRRRQTTVLRQGRRGVASERVPPRWRAAAGTDEGRFEPRPEFVKPRGEQRPVEARAASARPVRRGPPIGDEAADPAPEQVGDDTTWPAARPERPQRRAQVPGPGTAEPRAPARERGPASEAAEPDAWRLGDADRLAPGTAGAAGEAAAGGSGGGEGGSARGERVREAPGPEAVRRPDPRGGARETGSARAEAPGAGTAPGAGSGRGDGRAVGRDSGTVRAEAPGVGSAPGAGSGRGVEGPPAGEPASGRAGLGRAARAARGGDAAASDRGAPADARSGAGRHGPPAESKRPRRWAVRSDAAAGPAEVEPGELVGPDEVDGDEAARAKSARAKRPREEAGRDAGAGGGRRVDGGQRPRDARATRGERDAAGAGVERADDEPAGEEPAGEEPPRPKLEFPDEF